MSTFPRTRAAAASIARHVPGEPARARAAALLAILRALDGTPAGSHPPAASPAMLRDLVLAARDLVGQSWLAASDDFRAAAFTALQAAPAPPPRDELDEIISGALRARFSGLLWARGAAPAALARQPPSARAAPGPAARRGALAPVGGPRSLPPRKEAVSTGYGRAGPDRYRSGQ